MNKTTHAKPTTLMARTLSWLLLFSCANVIATTQPAHALQTAVAQTDVAAQKKTIELTKATVRKIDLTKNKITLQHEAIQNIGMPAMTMVFKVADPQMLQGITVGDAVQFAADKQDRQLLITALEKQPQS